MGDICSERQNQLLETTSSFFFDVPAPTEIYTLSLHDALPISSPPKGSARPPGPGSSTTTCPPTRRRDRKSTRLNSSHMSISYADFCLKKKNEHRAPVPPNHQPQRLVQ